MISYAQNFEDVILARAFRGRTDGFYVDIGAMDPELHSVTKCFYDRGWNGVNVEPSRHFHEMLCRDRPRDINLGVAVGATHGERTFHDSEVHGISTFSPHLVKHFSDLKYSFKARRVDVIALREICERYCHKPIDFMKIDVEGAEKEVLESGDWRTFRPRIVLVEAITPDTFAPSWASWEHLLVGNGYMFSYFDGLNRFYLRSEDESLSVHFRLPPNVLDGFETHEVVRLRRRQVPRTSSDSLASTGTSVWIVVEDGNEVEWRKVGDISLVPTVVLRVLSRCFSLMRRWTGVIRRFLRAGP
jgi:FkbM family methyltransferase